MDVKREDEKLGITDWREKTKDSKYRKQVTEKLKTTPGLIFVA